MNNGWRAIAKFEKAGDCLFRTKAYLQYGADTSDIEKAVDGNIIGIIVMFNPGKSRPREIKTGEYCISSIDPTMSQISGIISDAYIKADKHIPSGSLIEIMNLFDLCEPDKEKAVEKYRELCGEDVYKKYIRQDYQVDVDCPFVWKAWGRQVPEGGKSLVDKWDEFLKDFNVVGEPARYHPRYLNMHKRERADIVDQISRLI